MRHDKLTGLTPLGQVTTLVKLNIDYAQIAVPASASVLKSVKVLNATGAFANFDPLAGLTQLTELRVPLAVVDNFAILNQLVNLTVLDISYTGTSSISIVSGMTKLRELRLGNNQIVDIAALSGLGFLSYVDLTDNQVTDLGPLASNTGLATGDEVYFAFNPFSCTTQAANIATMVGRGVAVDSGCP
jgi:internalin A